MLLALGLAPQFPDPVQAAPFLLIQGYIHRNPGNVVPSAPVIRLYVTARPGEVLESGTAAVNYSALNGFYTVDLSYLTSWNSSEQIVVEAMDPLTGAIGLSPPELISNHQNNELINLLLALPVSGTPNRVGDANVDGFIDMLDAGMVQRRMYGLVSSSALGPGALASGDAAVDLADLMLIAQKAQGARTGLVGPGGSAASLFFSGIPSFLTNGALRTDANFNVISAWSGLAGKVNGLATTFTPWPPGGTTDILPLEDTVAASKTQAPLVATPAANPGTADFSVNINIMDSEGVSVVQSAGLMQSIPVYSAICNDGLVEFGESCEDGNAVGGDGCDASCRVEGGFCGDGVLNATEACDDGDTALCAGDCDETCTGYYLPVCGDGTSDCGEECEDGNLADGDGCSSLCEIEPAPFPLVEDFESAPALYWSLGGAAPASAVFTAGLPATGSQSLRLTSATGAPATARADLVINLAGQTGVMVRFAHWSRAPIGTELPAIFSGAPDGDGVAISPDGVTWRKLAGLALTESGTPSWTVHQYDLDQAMLDAGWSYTTRFRIRLQHAAYDTYPNDGGSFDWLVVAPATCGNGVIEPPENCDDGDLSGCTPACDQFCQGGHVLECGNGFVECGEICDDGDTDNCTPACNDYCGGPYPLACGDGIPECMEACDDGNLINGDGCDSNCQPECTPAVCYSNFDSEQWAGSNGSWPDGFNPGGWTIQSSGLFNGGSCHANGTSTAVFSGNFTTQSGLMTFYIWILGFRHTLAGDHSIAVRIDGEPVGTYVGTPVAVATLEWQMVGTKTLWDGPHTLELQGTAAASKWFDGYAITTSAALNPQTQWTPLNGYNLDNPALDYFGPGPPAATCCGDCILQAGEVCDDGDANGTSPGECLPDCSGLAP